MYAECYRRGIDQKLVIIGYNRWRVEFKVTGIAMLNIYRTGDSHSVEYPLLRVKQPYITYTRDNSGRVLNDNIGRLSGGTFMALKEQYSGYVSGALRMQPPYPLSRWATDVIVILHN